MLNQKTQQKLSQKISYQQIQLANLIALPALRLEEKIKEELEENPALVQFNEKQLDSKINDNFQINYRISNNNYSYEKKQNNIFVNPATSLSEHLLLQLNTFHLEDQEYTIAKFLIGSIDSNGYLLRSVTEILEDLAFIEKIYSTEQQIEKILNIIHLFNPSGIGARNLQECLLLQLKRKKQTKKIIQAINILEEFFDEFSKKQFLKIIQKLNISKELLDRAIQIILSLNPKPGVAFSESGIIEKTIIPDFTIRIIDNTLKLTLDDNNIPELLISKDFEKMIARYKKSKKIFRKEQQRTLQFMEQKLNNAKGFKQAVIQRQKTLYLTMSAIMHHQKDYLLTGDLELLKPLILEDIASKLEVDISTISRVSNNKYVDTPYGIKRVKYFFSEYTIDSKGEKIANKKIKEIIREIIGKEKKPLTDENIVVALKERGLIIPRRRIVDYRKQLNIPIARLRRKL